VSHSVLYEWLVRERNYAIVSDASAKACLVIGVQSSVALDHGWSARRMLAWLQAASLRALIDQRGDDLPQLR
jgi:hypothetical protein